jgi:DNA primase
MPGKIPQAFIDDLISRVDIVDVINPRVPLTRAGTEYKACCPFHDEKTPSFTVSPSKQFYHCFGCGAHGTALGFLMEYERLAFPEAVESLAESIGLEVPREAGVERGPDLGPLYDVLEQAARFYAWQLRRHADAARGTEYLRGRGVSGEIAAEFRIGFAAPGWTNLLDQLGQSPEQIRRLNEAGLIQDHDGKRYDRFRERILFPIRDTRGRVIGFGGRVLGDGTPKYLNSPETPVFHKGRELYGLYEARQADKHLEQVLVVEGYMDVVALAQFGIRNAVATLGTATTSEHLEKLYRVVPTVVFSFDGDRAGRDAGWKALQTALPLLRDGRQARFLFLPEGEDPDTLVRTEGADAFRQRVADAPPLSEFLLEHLREQSGGGIEGRARLAELARPFLDRLPSGAYRELIESRLESFTGVQRRETSREPARGRYRAREHLSTTPPVRRAVTMLLQNPALARLDDLPRDWQRARATGMDTLIELFEIARNEPHLHTAAIVERWTDPQIRRYLGRLAASSLEYPEDAEPQLRGALAALAKQTRAEELDKLAVSYRPSALSDEEKQRLRELYSSRNAEPEEDSGSGID